MKMGTMMFYPPFSNIVLTNLPGRVIYVHTKKKGGMCDDYGN